MRPLGVTLSACFEFVRGPFLILFAAGILLVSSLAARVAALAAEGSMLERFVSTFGRFVAVALLIYVLLQIILGIGLLLRQNWARLLTIVFCGLGVLTSLSRLVHLRFFSGLFAILNMAVLVYLLLPETKAYFEGRDLAVTRTP